jgi:hypothetical protein
MSRYGSIDPGAKITTRVVQSANPLDLARRVNAALAEIAALPNMQVIASMTLAGAGDGHTFTVTIEAAAMADVQGGLMPATPGVQCYMAAEASALLKARNALTIPDEPLVEVQVAGSAQGTRFMGMLVFGVLEGGGGGCLIPLSRVFYVDSGTTTPLPDQNGSISCPFASIQDALDAIPAPVDFSDVVIPWVLLVVNGFYDEDVLIPPNRSIALKAIQGLLSPTPLITIADGFGVGVIMTDPGFDTNRVITWDFTQVEDQSPFVSLEVEGFAFFGDSEEDPIPGISVIAPFEAPLEYFPKLVVRNTVIDVGSIRDDGEEKAQIELDLRHCRIAEVSLKVALLQAEATTVGDLLIGHVLSQNCQFFTATIEQPVVFATDVQRQFAMKDTVLTGEEGDFEWSEEIVMDAVTYFYLQSQGGGTNPVFPRYIVEDTTAAWRFDTRILPAGNVTIENAGRDRNFLSSPADLGINTVTLPDADAYTAGTTNSESARDVYIENIATGSGTVSVVAQGADTLLGGPVSLAAGEGVHLVPVSSSTWRVVTTK